MARYSVSNLRDDETNQQERDKQQVQVQQEQYHQMQRELIDAISRQASPDDIRILLASGARADGPITQGLHPIHYATYQNFVPAVELLIARRCDINAMDDNGYTSVHWAAERGFYELLEVLIKYGAKVCFTDIRKQDTSALMADEPLSLAISRDHLDCAELLLKNGADPNAKYRNGSEINQVNILNVASIKLLLDYGAKPDARDRLGLTTLMKAARHPQGYDTVKLLIEYGADVNDLAGERYDYRTVLHHSIFSGNLDLIRLLLTSGARYPKMDFDKPSPLIIAIISGRYDIAKLLIEFDADVNAGSTTTIGEPLQLALSQKVDNKFELVRLLLESGADPNSPTTSNRSTGPPLHDYLHSLRQCASSSPFSYLSGNFITSTQNFNLEMIRLLLMYGARVILKTPTQHPLGLVRTLERIREELSLDMLMLLIDAAEEIDWFMMSKVVYSCLRRTTRGRANELLDPMNSAQMTPEQLTAMLEDASAHHDGISNDLIKLLNGGKISSAALTLKQISRIRIRQHLNVELSIKGHKLIRHINCLPLPSVLRKYLLYQD